MDGLRRHRATPSRFAGIPVSVKDLFDMAGDVTAAGSVALRAAPAAKRDATVVGRIRAAGFIPIGRTNMTEFAFSGVGLNPHYDTPRNPYDRATGRLPGGSSSGAAVSVTDAMAVGALGTDTGGAVRPPPAGGRRHRPQAAAHRAPPPRGEAPALFLPFGGAPAAPPPPP